MALLVVGIGASLGGPTGYAINPARDLGPRIAHAVLPIRGKGDSDWGYAWIPVVGPIIGGVLAGLLANAFCEPVRHVARSAQEGRAMSTSDHPGDGAAGGGQHERHRPGHPGPEGEYQDRRTSPEADRGADGGADAVRRAPTPAPTAVPTVAPTPAPTRCRRASADGDVEPVGSYVDTDVTEAEQVLAEDEGEFTDTDVVDEHRHVERTYRRRRRRHATPGTDRGADSEPIRRRRRCRCRRRPRRRRGRRLRGYQHVDPDDRPSSDRKGTTDG